MANKDTAEDIADVATIESSAQLKALSHPLRVAILQRLMDGPLTNEELANLLGVASGKLYFHTKKLLESGFLTPAGTRQKGPVTEKLYRAKARRYALPDPVKGGESPPLAAAVAAGLELYRTTWHETGGLPGQLEAGFHLILPQSAERRRDLLARCKALFDDFREGPGAGATDAETLALTVLLHAVPRFTSGSPSDNEPQKDTHP